MSILFVIAFSSLSLLCVYQKLIMCFEMKIVFFFFDLILASCFVLQLAFILHFESYVEAAQYSAFLQNVAAMSLLFIVMLYKRDSSEGQSMLIGIAKWLGTLAPTIQQGIVQGFNIFILMTGLLCSVWDITYIVLLKKKMNEEKAHLSCEK